MNVALDHNPYQAYTDGSVLSDNPLNLVVALYEGALDATRQAELAIQTRDILGRTKAINKAISILSELLASLDLERGGEIGRNLKRLYSYMQVRLLNAHARQVAEPIAEVSSLLATLLEGWRGAGKEPSAGTDRFPQVEQLDKQMAASPAHSAAPFYGGYLEESTARGVGSAYSF
jgi:flagellar protein FliS